MKQHITPSQAQEITEEQFYSLFDEIVKRKDWANFHHKKVAIGKCIEIIDGYSCWRIEDEGYNHECTLTLFKTKFHEFPIAKFKYEGLINTLWATVKFILKEREDT